MDPDLGVLLALIHDAPGKLRTVSATVRTWTHRERSQAAFMAETRGRGTQFAVAFASDDGGGEPDEVEEVIRYWIEPPERAREESDERLAIRDGETWWMNVDGRLVTNGGDEHYGGGAADRFELWLAPYALLGTLRLEPIGPGAVAGRAAHRVRATARRGRELHFELHRLGGAGAEEYELAIDAELGILLAVEARFEGASFYHATVESIDLDAELDPALFQPPPGVEAVLVTDAFARPQHDVAVHEAAVLADFPLFVPAGLPDDWRLGHGIWIVDPPSYHLHYSDRTGAQGFSLAQSRDDPAAANDWQDRSGPYDETEVGDHTALVRDRGDSWPQTQIRLVRDGTAIEVTSESLSADTLWPLLAGLVPAPESPPSF